MAAEFLRQHGVDLQYEMSKVQFGDPTKIDSSFAGVYPSAGEQGAVTQPVLQAIHTIEGVRLSTKDSSTLWDVKISAGEIISVMPHYDHPTKRLEGLSTHYSPTETSLSNTRGRCLAPSLCHPHIHLDKCFLLFDPKYSDLEIVQGDFSEAMALTAKAKARFGEDDLMRRGRWLVTESLAAGVTCMRAFVEVDADVGFKCLDAGLKLKDEFKNCCHIQICAFAQEPVLSESKNHPEGKTLLEEALGRDGVDVLGSTPYVEANDVLIRANIDWAISTALKHGKHLDLHIDYNLDHKKIPMTEHVIEAAKAQDWLIHAKGKTIVLGHCTRLTLLKTEEWLSLRVRIADLPIFFIGLPTSDLLMARNPDDEEGAGRRTRGTLQIPEMIKKYELNGAIGVNNVGNPFTPQGNCDPMSLASVGVCIYQTGTKKDTELLYVSNQ